MPVKVDLMKPGGRKSRALLWEASLLLLAVTTYLLVFEHVLPHGDALRVVRQIESATLTWNPNHLLFDPVGVGFAKLSERLLPGVNPLDYFELISGISTLISLAIFLAVLVRLGVPRGLRSALVVALFASASFLSLAGGQYFFMIQMPLLLGALYLYLGHVQRATGHQVGNLCLYGMGFLLALATGVMFNNLFVLIGLGIVVAFDHSKRARVTPGNAMRIYFAAALVGFPLFMLGHWLSGSEIGLFTWVRSYEGNAASQLNQFYGLRWSVRGVLEGMSRAGFNLLLGSIVEHAGLGTVLWVMAFGQTLEFVPQWGRIGLGLAAIVPTALITLLVIAFALRRFRSEPLVRFLAVWVAMYVLFNILWDCNDEIFWFQILPALWILFAASLGALSAPFVMRQNEAISPRKLRITTYVLWAFACILLVVNTWNLIVPLSDRGHYEKQTRAAALLQDGDTLIVPGWDQQKWLAANEGGAKVEREVLMNLATSAADVEVEFMRLRERIEQRLDVGSRVIVFRLFDIDEDIMPWYGLRRIGWPRERIQGLFSTLCHQPIGQVGGTTFRQLRRCDHPNGP